MALLQMKKIRIITYGNETSKLLEVLQKLGTFEFIEPSDSFEKYNLKKREKTVFEFNYVSSRLDFAVNFLSKYQKRSFLKKAFDDPREDVTRDEAEKIANSFYFNDLVERIADLETQMSEAEQKILKLDEEAALLKDWAGMDIPLGSNLETAKTVTILIRTDAKEADLLPSKLQEKNLVFNLQSVRGENFVLTYFKEDKEAISAALSEAGAQIAELPKRRGTPEEELERIERARITALKEIDSANEEAQKISNEHLSKIKILSDYFYWKKAKDDILMSAVGTENASIFEGWCPVKKFDKLEKELSKASDLYDIEDLPIKEDEVRPVEIENNKLFKPFETITRLYGLPSSKDLDPTVFLAGFFFIFFGLCLTDVVYGLVILALLSLIFFFYRVPKEAKPLFTLLMLGGLSSVIIGFFFGGYLGVDIKFLPEWMRKIQLFDPIASPLPIFYLSLIMGVIQVIAGIALKILAEAKNNNLKGGLLDKGPWLLLFFTAILFIGGKAGIWASSQIYLILVYASLAAIVLTQGRKEKSVFKKGFKGVLSLYDSVSYFSDILSYSRLLALGLATSALAFSINLIALLARDLVPYVGLILMVIILIIGHLFNLVVNVLGAFIHSARLQFVEFFGKFLSGNGRNFKPFRQEERNVVIIE